jgi:NADH-dependent peroxiredoxin subunit C
MLQLGDSIPDYSLDAYYQDKLFKINLSEYKDKWLIILFYPADFTFVCPTELEEAAENYQAFKDLGAEIVSISTDTNYVHKAWHDESKAVGKVAYPMLSDHNGALCQQFGVYNQTLGQAHRATFIIDPDQHVIAYEVHDDSIGRNIHEILRKLQAAKFVRDNGGDIACPASWHPGEKTLKPGIKLVGKI